MTVVGRRVWLDRGVAPGEGGMVPEVHCERCGNIGGLVLRGDVFVCRRLAERGKCQRPLR